MKQKVIKVNKIKKILAILLDLLIGILILALIKINIIPTKYLVIILGALIVFGLIITVLCFKTKNKVLSVLLILISIISGLLFSFGIKYIYTTDKFFSSIEEVTEKSIYYVVVNKDSNFKTLESLKDKNIGIFKDVSNTYIDALTEVEKEIEIKEKEYDNVNNIIKDLYENKIDSILLNSNNYNLIEENLPEFLNKTKIIKELSVEVIRATKEQLKSYNEPFSMLISGIDTSGNINNVSRSDVNIVVTVNPNTHEMLLTTIPRDYYVQLHGTTGLKDKLTHAGIYGVDMSMNTIGDLLEADIDYYLRVNFDTVVKMVDAVGGVEVYSDETFTAYDGTVFNEGTNYLDGKKALAYSRERKVFNEGDRKRGIHQQQVIEALVKKITTSKVLLSKYSEILSDLSDSFQTNISDSMIKHYIRNQIKDMEKWNVTMISLDGAGSYNYTYSMPGWNLYVMEPDYNTVNKAKEEINKVLNNK